MPTHTSIMTHLDAISLLSKTNNLAVQFSRLPSSTHNLTDHTDLHPFLGNNEYDPSHLNLHNNENNEFTKPISGHRSRHNDLCTYM